MRKPRSTRSVSTSLVEYSTWIKNVSAFSLRPLTTRSSSILRSSHVAERPFFESTPDGCVACNGGAVSAPSIDLNASNSHRFSCVESDPADSISFDMRSRACCLRCFVHVGGAITSNANARIASARVMDVNVAGLNARSLIGTSISRSNCCCSRAMMFCRCSAIASSALSSSLPSFRCRYSSCDSLRKSSSVADCVSTNRAGVAI